MQKLSEELKNAPATAIVNKYQLKIFLDIANEESDHIAFIADIKKEKLFGEFTNDKGEHVSTDLTYSLGGIEGLDLTFLNKKRSQIKSLYSIDYLANIILSINAPTVNLELQNDSPLILKWKEKHLSGTYLLAPRIQSD